MTKKRIVRKVFTNKRNNQLNVPLSKKQLKLHNPSIKFDEELFVSLSIFNKSRKK